MRKKIYLSYVAMLCAAILMAAPAKKGWFPVEQPDGTVFMARLEGDEWRHRMITEDGCEVIRGESGFYCYAVTSATGRKVSSGLHVGTDPVPASVLTESRNLRPRRAAATARRTVIANKARNITVRPQESRIRHGIIILVAFKNQAFTYTRSDFENSINGSAATSAVSYFNDQFNSTYDFRFDITGPVTLDNNYEYYGANDDDDQDIRPQEMVADACRRVAADVDFSKYDNDNDGYVDNVFIYYAGPDEAEGAGEDRIWSHMFYLLAGDEQTDIHLELNGKIIDNYACTSELMTVMVGRKKTYVQASIGTFCHEYSHSFGLPDYYDTDYEKSGGEADGLWGSLSLMHAGNQNNEGKTPPYYTALDRYDLYTWGHPGMKAPVPLSVGTHRLSPIGDSGDYYLLQADYDGEYYLFEARAEKGWDQYIGGSGLLIYHVDKSERLTGISDSYNDYLNREMKASERWAYNEVNCRPEHQCADLIECNPSAKAVSQVFWPYLTRNQYNAESRPAFKFWSGEDSPLFISDIRKDGEDVVFTVTRNSVIKAPNVTSLTIDKRFQDAAILNWEASDQAWDLPCTLKYWPTSGSDVTEVSVSPYEIGHYSYIIEGLSPRTPYRIELVFSYEGNPGKVTEDRFTTISYYEDSYPFIYLKDTVASEDGSFAPGTEIPLRIYNAPGAVKTEWTFDGDTINPGGNGYYKLERSGVLKAVATFEDGSRQIMLRKINVSPAQ